MILSYFYPKSLFKILNPSVKMTAVMCCHNLYTVLQTFLLYRINICPHFLFILYIFTIRGAYFKQTNNIFLSFSFGNQVFLMISLPVEENVYGRVEFDREQQQHNTTAVANRPLPKPWGVSPFAPLSQRLRQLHRTLDSDHIFLFY